MEFKLKSIANDYLDDILSFDNLTCSFARKHIQSKGKILSVTLPKSSNMKGINNYSVGGLLSVKNDIEDQSKIYNEISDTSGWLASYIFKKITKDNCVCIFDDVMGSPNDLKGFESTSFIIGSDIVHIASNRNIDVIEDIEKLIFATKVSWHFVCLIVKTNDSLSEMKDTIEFNIEKDMGFISEIVVGAYDGEAFIVARL
jgi:hypothetical protein